MTDFESQAHNSPPVEAPKKTAESYEDFDRVFAELKSEVLVAVDSGKNLPPDVLEKFHRELGHISDLFKADTVYGVEAELCRRLVEAYQKGDMEALKNMPYAGSHTTEEQRKLYKEHIEMGLYGEGVTVDQLMNIPRVCSNTLTGGADFNQRDNLKDLGTFGNENTGYHASSYFERGNERITGLLSTISSSITDKLDLLANFIEEKRCEIKRAIISVTDFQKAITELHKLPSGKEKLECSKKLSTIYLEKEIERKVEIIQLGERMEQLFKLIDEFIHKVVNKNT